MKEDIEKVLDKLDSLDNRLDSVDKTLIQQHESLKYHIKRSDATDSVLDSVKEKQNTVVMKHINQWNGALKLLTIIATVIAIIGGIYTFI